MKNLKKLIKMTKNVFKFDSRLKFKIKDFFIIKNSSFLPQNLVKIRNYFFSTSHQPLHQIFTVCTDVAEVLCFWSHKKLPVLPSLIVLCSVIYAFDFIFSVLKSSFLLFVDGCKILSWIMESDFPLQYFCLGFYMKFSTFNF